MMHHRFSFLSVVLLLFTAPTSWAQEVPFGQEELVRHLDQELSGESAKRNLEYISRLHRMRGSDGYNTAITFIEGKMKEYKLEKIETIKIPTDGKTMYGTQKSRPAWNVSMAELWEMEQKEGSWEKQIKLADWESIPMVVAQDSHSGEVEAELVDIGAGTSEADYKGKDVKGKLVLTSSQPGAVAALAVKKYGAVGILSHVQNQVTAWWKEDENLIRWGHLETFSDVETFGFMVSLKQARSFQQRLEAGKTIRLHAKVEAAQTVGSYDILTAVIEGSDPQLKTEEIAFTCHLDHPRPGANDNASGSTVLIEVARTLKKLIDEGQLDRPKRTLRFIWSPEIEGTTALLNFRPDYAANTKFNIHMDMVGGGPSTKAIFHVSKSPMSLPNFIDDVGMAFGEFVNESSAAHASGQSVTYPVISSEGGKEALQARLGEFHVGSDFEVFNEGSFRIPSIYLHDWPDRYIHTNYDQPGNIDPTKLKRSGFIGAGAGYYLANFSEEHVDPLAAYMQRQVLQRTADMMAFAATLKPAAADNLKYHFWEEESLSFQAIKPFATLSKSQERSFEGFLNNLQKTVGAGEKEAVTHAMSGTIYRRNDKVKGAMFVFGYNYFFDHYGRENTPAIFSYSSSKAGGYEYSYEALNFVDGKRDVGAIRNALSAQFGPIPMDVVAEYLQALSSIEVVLE